MSREKQIEEMACAMCGHDKICGGVEVEKCIIYPDYRRQANRLYNAGYRKQSEDAIIIPPMSDEDVENLKKILKKAPLQIIADDKPEAWISVDERLPESEKIVLVSAVSKTFGYRHTLMVAHIGYHEFTTEDTDWREFEGDTEYDEENDCFWVPECWYEVNSVEDNGNWIIDSDYVVTHWMPLPEAPKMKGGAE